MVPVFILKVSADYNSRIQHYCINQAYAVRILQSLKDKNEDLAVHLQVRIPVTFMRWLEAEDS
jgi:hypothetical protein